VLIRAVHYADDGQVTSRFAIDPNDATLKRQRKAFGDLAPPVQ